VGWPEVLRSRGLRFVVVGAWNTVFGFLAFTVLLTVLSDALYLPALVIAQTAAVVQAHWTQRHFVWRSASPYLTELMRFSTIYIVVLIANVVLLYGMVEWVSSPPLVTQYVIGGALILASYFAQRRWAFAAALTTPATEPARRPTSR
jgi:putative flippase GtrA